VKPKETLSSIRTSQPSGRSHLVAYAIRLEYFTVSWNVLEALVALASGIIAGSIALVGFGLDSVVESMAAGVLMRRLLWEQGQSEGGDGATADSIIDRERRALRWVGWTFLALSAFVAVESVRKLWLGDRPDTSVPGLILLCLSLVVMPFLAAAKFRTARELGSMALRGDAKETLVCSVLSVITLTGLILNSAYGWWWADPVAALALLPWILKEGIEAIRTDGPGA